MICPKCQSGATTIIPAEIRLYRNGPRTLSHPPMTPSPDVRVCLDCGWSEFAIPQSWLSAGWLQSLRTPAAPGVASVDPATIAAEKNRFAA
jgi:hypothetical protein